MDHHSRVVGVTTAKAGEPGAEGVSLALPGDNVCRALRLDCQPPLGGGQLALAGWECHMLLALESMEC